MAGKYSDDVSDADLTMTLDEFIAKFTLPHFARVKEGIYEPYDPNCLEISNGELLELYRVVYPLTVTLDFDQPTSGMKQKVSVSTMNDDLRFHVLTWSEKPRMYRTVTEVIEAWPLLVMCKTDDANETVSVHDGVFLKRPAFRMNDELRLVRRTWNDDKNLILEVKIERTGRLVRLPTTDAGQFLELTDPKSYTLQELIDMAVVQRRLKLDQTYKYNSISLKGIPRHYSGTLHLATPLVQLQVSRLQQDEHDSDITVSDPFLIPIDCGIVLSPRDETYKQKPCNYMTYTLSSLIETANLSFPSVARVVSWTEQSCFLQNHLVRPGDYLVFYSKRTVDWILAHRLDRYFLIPVSSRGRFISKDNSCKSQLRLDMLNKQEFPIRVQFLRDVDSSSGGEELSLDAYIEEEPCVIACKIFGDSAGRAFHLPLRTRIRVLPVEWRGERLPKDPTRFSSYDDSVMEIPVNMYEDIMEHPSNQRSRQKAVPEVPATPNVSKSRPTPKKRTSIARPTATQGDTPVDSCADAEYMTPREADAGLSQLSLSEEVTVVHPYENASLIKMSAHRKSSKESAVVIPDDGNITNFTASEMTQFLQQMKVPDDVIMIWKERRITGKEFARMSDENLRDYGLDTAVIQFFRNSSRVRLSCLDRL